MSAKQIPTITSKIRPEDIDIKGGFMASKYQNSETEASIYWLCKFAAARGNWNSFTQKEIDKFAKHVFHFNHLIPYGDIICTRKVKLSLVDSSTHIVTREDVEKNQLFPIHYHHIGAELSQEIRVEVTDEVYHFTDGFINEAYRLCPKNKKK